MPAAADLPVVVFPRTEFPTPAAAHGWLLAAVEGIWGPVADVLLGLDLYAGTEFPPVEMRSPFPPLGVVEVASTEALDTYAHDHAADIAAADKIRPDTTAQDILDIISAFGESDPAWAWAAHPDSDGYGRFLGPQMLHTPAAAWRQASRLGGWIVLGREQLATAKKRADLAKALRTVEDAYAQTLDVWAALVWRWTTTARLDAENGPYIVVTSDDATDSPATRRGSNPAGTPRLGY
jgi:hypothetical protein